MTVVKAGGIEDRNAIGNRDGNENKNENKNENENDDDIDIDINYGELVR